MVYSNFENCFKEITMHSLTILQFPDLKLKFVGHTLKTSLNGKQKNSLLKEHLHFECPHLSA